MKFFAVSLLAGLAAASPIAVPEPTEAQINDAQIEALAARQFLSGSKNELEQGSSSSCPKAILVFARGTTEQGNLVSKIHI
jgi:cutinase